MRKEVQMSIKMESELRDRFMVAASALHRLRPVWLSIGCSDPDWGAIIRIAKD